MLHAALERAVKERLISRNPTEDCIAPKPRKLQMQILPPEAIHAYLEAAKASEKDEEMLGYWSSSVSQSGLSPPKPLSVMNQ